VTARFDGDLERVLVREGQAVRAGQSLAVYAPRDVRDASLAAEADILAAKADLLAAENTERRAKRLLAAGAAAARDVEAAEAALAAAEARLRAAEAGVNRARENVEKLVVPSPIAGWVSTVFVHDGDRTAVGDPLFTLVDTDTLELSATVPSEALARVAVGTPIRFRVDAFPGETFTSQVDRLGPTTEPGTRQVRLYTRVPNPGGRLVGGVFATGRIVDAARDSALAAPIAVLRREGSAEVVYRLSGGKAERVSVEVGLRDEERSMVELIGAVARGDSLLTGVLAGLRDGIAVRVASTGGAAPRPE
jgi:RND family efflux transporter MFP subunit